jgi:hypothetical protein
VAQTVCGFNADLQREHVAVAGAGVRSHCALRWRVRARDFFLFGTAIWLLLSLRRLAFRGVRV